MKELFAAAGNNTAPVDVTNYYKVYIVQPWLNLPKSTVLRKKANFYAIKMPILQIVL